MKKKTRKMVLLTGVLCMLSLAVCACGKTEEPQDAAEPQVVQGEPIPEDDTKEEDSTPEPSAETEGTGGEDKQESPGAETVPESGENSNRGTDSTQKEQPEAQPEAKSTSGTSAQWDDSTPNLEGSVKDLKDGQLTVVESIIEKADNGGDIMVGPGSGDDSEFNKVTVTYDENTLFGIQTIYDGGARFEMSAATAADLAAGQHIQVWGSSSGSGLKATEICIVKVE